MHLCAIQKIIECLIFSLVAQKTLKKYMKRAQSIVGLQHITILAWLSNEVVHILQVLLRKQLITVP